MLSVIKILAIFGLICWLTTRRIPLGFSLLVGVLLVGLFFGMPVGEFLSAVGKHATERKTLELALMVALILALSHLLQATGQTQRMVASLEGLIRSTRARLAILPGLIGLLPMPGGALFSAPMVKEASAGSDYEAHHITAINHWFRHVWEYCWPLYPGLILLTSLEGVNLPLLSYAALQSPLTVVALVAGFLFVFGHVQPPPAPSSAHRPLGGRVVAFLGSVAPILVILVVTAAVEVTVRLLLPLVVPLLPSLHGRVAALCERWPWPTKSTSLVVGLMASIVYMVAVNRLSPLEQTKAVARNKHLWLLVLLAFSIKIFAGMILDSHAAEQVADWLQEQHVPLLAIAAVLPFLVGLITGITVAFVGVAFPLLLGLMMGMDSHLKLSYLVFAYAWGFTGVLISPVHVCLVATLEYFQADLTKTYRWLIPASVGVLVGATGMHLLLRFGWA
jgi:hypothetical protein